MDIFLRVHRLALGCGCVEILFECGGKSRGNIEYEGGS